jgi:CPA2 family monovalent cation:H+ antiporter-2
MPAGGCGSDLRAEGPAAVYGDAARPETLAAAGVGRAAALVLSASGIKGPREVVRLARSAYLRERADLRKAGADVVFSGEGEVALAMVESVLRELGASPEQIDRQRERVRADLFGDTADEHRGGPSTGNGLTATA